MNILNVFLISVLFSIFAMAEADVAIAPQTKTARTVEKCQAYVNSWVCEKFKGQPGALKEDQCQAEINGDNWSVLSRLSNCASGLALSVSDIVTFLIEGVKFVGKAVGTGTAGLYNYLTDGDPNAASRESIRDAWQTSADYLGSLSAYIAIEYQKAYAEVGAPWNLTESSRAFRAGLNMRGRLMGALLNVAMEVIKSKYQEFYCFDNNKQVELTCRVMGDLFLPPTAILGVAKHGLKGLNGLPKVTSKLEEMLKLDKRGKELTADDILKGKQDLKGPNGPPPLPEQRPPPLPGTTPPPIPVEKGISGIVGNKTPYISFMDKGRRRAAQVLEESKDQYRVRMQGTDGKPYEKWISKDDLVGARDSDSAAIAFERLGDPSVDKVRDAYISGEFVKGDEFISYLNGTSNSRSSARVSGFNPQTGALEIEDLTVKGIVRREMSAKEILSARKSDTARSNYNAIKGSAPQNQVANSVATSAQNVVRGQAKIDQYAPLVDLEAGKGSYFGDGYWRQWIGSKSDELPLQGWKLHVGASPEHAGQIAEKLAPMLREQKIPHKIVGDLSKYVKRDRRKDTQAGKFITIYPRSSQEAADIAKKVDEFNRSIGLKGENFIAPPGERQVGNGVWARFGRIKGGVLVDANGRPFKIPAEFQHLNPSDLIIGPNGRIELDVRGRASPDWAPDPF